MVPFFIPNVICVQTTQNKLRHVGPVETAGSGDSQSRDSEAGEEPIAIHPLAAPWQKVPRKRHSIANSSSLLVGVTEGTPELLQIKFSKLRNRFLTEV